MIGRSTSSIVRLVRTSLSVRFVLATAVMVLPLLLLAGIGYGLLQRTVNSFDSVIDEVSTDLVSITDIQSLLLQSSSPVVEHLLLGRPQARRDFQDLKARIDKGFEDAISNHIRHPSERTMLESAHAHWDHARRLSEKILVSPYPVTDPAVAQDVDRVAAGLKTAVEILAQVYQIEYRAIMAHHAQAARNKRAALLFFVVMLNVAIGIAIITGAALARRILIPIDKLTQGAARFGAGDLGYRVDIEKDDELGDLAATFNDMADRIQNLATHDGLTGLYNYREFHYQLAQEIERTRRYGTPFSMLMIDIDYFKVVNDSYGHLAGDAVLREAAAIIGAQVRPIDHVARYGGEEIATLLPQTDTDDAVVIAERIRTAVASYDFQVDATRTLCLTVSVGIACFPTDAETGSALVDAADRALYLAKKGGRDRVVRFDRINKPAQGASPEAC